MTHFFWPLFYPLLLPPPRHGHSGVAVERSAKCPECPFYAFAGLQKGTRGGMRWLEVPRVPIFNQLAVWRGTSARLFAVSASEWNFVTHFFLALILSPFSFWPLSKCPIELVKGFWALRALLHAVRRHPECPFRKVSDVLLHNIRSSVWF